MCLQFRLKRISKYAFNIITSTPEGTEPLCKMLDEELRNYTAALQDMNYMDRFGLKENVDDPFIITTEKTSQQALLRDVWKEKKLSKPDKDEPKPFSENPQTPNKVKQDLWQLPEYPQHSVPKPLDRSKQFDISQDPIHRFREEARQKHLEIFIWAFVGNLSLIGPMILMVLKPGLITSLVTTSVRVTIFAAVATSFQDKIGDAILATAAYAAVLVVFVGTIGGGSSV
ncbi:hypothetical protein CGCF415_v008189 [Colletotrichum fructicola]|uniref:DUF6594 domain-containing protein n=1 Tax=Colletotrichum fructicola (strain Nara gc5) TaxID=1213859 RepID=A0A7J6JTY3_COLFN|nr:uncharacterized protein CGMCC3_g3068 [Colletotrichum fructicola]KAF4493152.1 hypothetical protein CGGC5_v001066 [Colletotrichum fructicola Nara gc5]KAE9580856.1 hypothetical protein CGMCC3_g3068 [Colletotrichum fructicola]KAF4898287.1 hypothetical protein CGCFRS4_v004582 [Colletotrichum fructicola]KAF4905780.1 hypothetical protein CGCF415_v008189 [Colletotrichum fructicola]KAF4938006.1 hypothetical protein CGCF245_v005139 [Colletotrichum fructicola]